MSLRNYDKVMLERNASARENRAKLNATEGRTEFNRDPLGIMAVRSLIPLLELRGKELKINNIGVGAHRPIVKSGNMDAYQLANLNHMNTYEPYELANAAIKEGVKPDIMGYTMSKGIAASLSKNKRIILPPHEGYSAIKEGLHLEIGNVTRQGNLIVIEPHDAIKKSVRFGSMDIINGTPVRMAHITYSKNVLIHMTKEERSAALKNMSDSTLKGGFIITDRSFDEGLLRSMGLQKINLKNGEPKSRETIIYQKL